MFIDNYRVLFEDYSERHYAKAFKKDYGNQWLVTRNGNELRRVRDEEYAQKSVSWLKVHQDKVKSIWQTLVALRLN